MAQKEKSILTNHDFARESKSLLDSLTLSSTSSALTVINNISPTQTVQIGVRCPSTGSENIFVVKSTESVGHLRRHALLRSGLGSEKAFNFGLYLPPQGNRNGKFLEEERPISDYPVLLQGATDATKERSRGDTDESSSSAASHTLTNWVQTSPDSGVGQDLCWLELVFKSRMDVVESPHHSRMRKLKTKVTQSYFMELVRNRDIKGLERLLARGFDPNFWYRKDGEAPITAAATIYSPREVLITLVSGGAHIDFRAKDSHTALHRAAICGNYEAIKTLLDLGQNPNCKDSRGLTPLYYAVSTDISAKCTHALLYDHAIIGVEDENGLQEIHQACKANRPQHLENLIAYGADLNARTPRGQTPLHLCVRHEADACLRQLLLRGADPSQVNEDNQTPYEYALLTNRNEQAVILKNFNVADVVAINEPPSYNTSRRPTVNGPRGAVAYSMFRRSSSANPETGSLRLNLFSPSESLFSSASSDRASVTSFDHGGNANVGNHHLSGQQSFVRAGSVVNVRGNDEESIHSLRQFGGTPKMTRRPMINDAWQRKHSTPDRSYAPSVEYEEVKTYNRVVAMRRGSNGFGFTLHGVPRKAMLRHGQQLLLDSPSNQYFSNVVPGGPADRAGIREGDYVIEIDGQDVTRSCHEDAVECIRSCGDSLIMRVLTVYKASTLRRQNGQLETPILTQDERSRPRYRDISGGTSSGHLSSSCSSTMSSETEKEFQHSQSRERPPPAAIEGRMRSRDRSVRSRASGSGRAPSPSLKKEVVQLHTTSPAATSVERVFVFEKIDGKTRAIPLDKLQQLKCESQSRAYVKFADEGRSKSRQNGRQSGGISSSEDNDPQPMKPLSILTTDYSQSESGKRSLQFTIPQTNFDSTATRSQLPYRSGLASGAIKRIDARSHPQSSGDEGDGEIGVEEAKSHFSKSLPRLEKI